MRNFLLGTYRKCVYMKQQSYWYFNMYQKFLNL